MSKIRWPIALMAVAVLALALPLLASANNSWSKYHWDKTTSEKLNLGDNLDTLAWDASLGIASTDWNQSIIKNQIVAGTAGTACDPVLGAVEVCNAEYGDNGWLGIAQVWVYRGKDGHIAQGLVKLNDTYFNDDKYNSQPWRDYVTCQEIGHTLGLGHQDETFGNANLGTCMDYTSDPDGKSGDPLSNEHPNQHDYDLLAEKYGHLNGTEPVEKPGNGNGKGKKNKATGQGNSDWGQAIGVDGNGRSNLFEQTLRNGDKVFTHVFWAN